MSSLLGKEEKNLSYVHVIETALRNLMALWEYSLDLFFLPVIAISLLMEVAGCS